MATAQDILNVMKGWYGYSEANGKFRQIIDLYNSIKPLPRGYVVKYTDEWCDTTVSAAGIKAGCTNLIGRECGCEEHIKIFKQLGIWIEDGTITPKPGYIIVYNWDDTTQPNDGYSDHIGFVESVNGGYITCIEGNKGAAVARRTIPIGWGCVRGYAAPKYTDSSSEPITPTEPTTGGLDKNADWVGIVTADELNVRTWAGTEYPLCSFSPLTLDTKIEVCDNLNDWLYIKYQGKYGFVHADYVQKEESSTTGDLSRIPKWVGEVSATSLYVRTWAGTEYPTIKSWPMLAQGNRVDVCDIIKDINGANWYYIRIAGHIYGFVHSNYIKRI